MSNISFLQWFFVWCVILRGNKLTKPVMISHLLYKLTKARVTGQIEDQIVQGTILCRKVKSLTSQAHTPELTPASTEYILALKIKFSKVKFWL